MAVPQFAPDIRPALKVSPSIHEAAVLHYVPKPTGMEKAEVDPELAGLASALKAAREEALVLTNLDAAVRADTTLPPAAAALALRNAATKSGERIAARLDAALERAKATIASIEKATFAPEAPREAAGLQLEAEIRAAIKAMGDKDKTAAISKAIATNDMSIVGAILRGPGLLTGLGDAELASVRHRYQQANFPKEMAKRERLEKALAAARTGGLAFVELVTSAADNKMASMADAATQRRVAAMAAHAEGE